MFVQFIYNDVYINMCTSGAIKMAYAWCLVCLVIGHHGSVSFLCLCIMEVIDIGMLGRDLGELGNRLKLDSCQTRHLSVGQDGSSCVDPPTLWCLGFNFIST